MPENGRLFVIATPLGNLGDVSERFKEVITSVDVVLCEDTRTTGKLLSLLNIRAKKLVSYHEHNELKKAGQVIEWLKQGLDVALLSDAGTPLVSDPGYRIVRAARTEGIEVYPVPGPSAVIAALSVSGLPTDKFLFAGFVPKKQGARKKIWELLTQTGITGVVFVPARSLQKVLVEVREYMEDPEICVCREMTKVHEEYLFGRCSEVLEMLESRSGIKGEVTLVISKKQ